jgi:hypothetical protein
MSRRLLLTPGADRFFLVPGETPPPGELEVISLDGETLKVDASAMVQHEVSEAEARAHLQERAQRAFTAVADVVGKAFGLGGAADVRRVAERLGVAPGDPSAAQAALGRLADDLHAVSAAVASGTPADLESARARLAARGIDLGAGFEDLPDLVATLRRLDQERAQQAVVRGLRAAADSIERTGEQPLGRRIDELIERLEREIGPLMGRDPKREEERRQAEYRASAKSSIADALRARGITPLASAEPDGEADR